jgi:hypothetical protein
MLTEIPHIEGRDFYPELAQVGKGYFRSFEKAFTWSFMGYGCARRKRTITCDIVMMGTTTASRLAQGSRRTAGAADLSH